MIVRVDCPFCRAPEIRAKSIKNADGLIALELINHKRCRKRTACVVRLSCVAPVLGYTPRGVRKLLAKIDVPVFRQPGGKFFLTAAGFEMAIRKAKKSAGAYHDIIAKVGAVGYNKRERAFRRWDYQEILILIRHEFQTACKMLDGRRTPEAIRQKIRRL